MDPKYRFTTWTECSASRPGRFNPRSGRGITGIEGRCDPKAVLTFRGDKYLPPPHRNQTKLLRSSNHPMGGAPHSTARKVQWLARRPKTSRTRIINSYYYWFLSYLRSRVKCQEFFMVVHVFLHDHISVHCSKSNRYCPLELMNRLVQKHSEAVGPLYHQKPWSKMTLHSSFNKWVLHNRAGKGGERDADW